MGKKDKKNDKAKVEAKKARQASKQEKAATKRNKKEAKESGEGDIESIIAEFKMKDQARTAVTVTPCDQPSPRSNFSMTALPNGEMMMFGGEFCDGEDTTVFNELFRWNVEKNEWKQIESLNTPPPRCSHQSVFYKDKLYTFGGEYATLDQFYHYRDLWALDIKTNTWEEIRPTGDCPSARSGHRMVIWRNYLVLFGGFYEALRDVRWFNDLYLFSFQEMRWTLIPYKPHALVPKPRSGFQMCIHAAEDTVYVYGGYSKEKVPGQKKEGKIHEDMWMLNLRPILPAQGASGRAQIDAQKAVWQRVSKKGHYPSSRCGAVMNVYKNKAILFGGVFDDEGTQHSMISTFYNDMYAFDMERRRWYQLGLKQPKKVGEKRKKKKPVGDANGAQKGTGDSDNDDDDDDDDDESDTESDDQDDAAAAADRFGYIDENGNVVYVDLEADDPLPAEQTGSGDADHLPGHVDPVEGLVADMKASGIACEDDGKEGSASGLEHAGTSKKDVAGASGDVEKMELPEVDAGTLQSNNDKPSEDNETNTSGKAIVHLEDLAVDVNAEDSLSKSLNQQDGDQDDGVGYDGYLAKYFLGRSDPSARINPCLMMRGNTIYIYGGVTELGDIEITLDDCWSLDLNKRDCWRRVLDGTMHNLVWKGEDLDGTEDGTNASDDDEDSDEEEEEEEESEEEEEEDDNHGTSKSKKSKGEKASAVGEAGGGRRRGGAGGAKGGGLRAEIEALRSQYDMTDSNRSPLNNESLKLFYGRTNQYWSSEVVRIWNEKREGASGAGEVPAVMTEKEVKREGFLLAEARYSELSPALERLNELEQQQAEMEEDKGKKGGSKKRR